jgi:Ca2+/Na+ antiporter
VGNASTAASFQRPLIVMLAVTVLTGVLALTTKALGRREGAILLITYPLILLSI